MPKKRVTEHSTTVETRNGIPTPVPFKIPSGELRENVNSKTSWLKSVLSALKLVKRPKR